MDVVNFSAALNSLSGTNVTLQKLDIEDFILTEEQMKENMVLSRIMDLETFGWMVKDLCSSLTEEESDEAARGLFTHIKDLAWMVPQSEVDKFRESNFQ